MIIVNHTTQIRVRYAETDKMGVVYNGEYLSYLEVGRTELIRSIGLPYYEFEKHGYLLPLTESYVKYIKSAYYDDILDIIAVINFEPKPTLRIDYEIKRDNELISTAFTIHYYLSSKTGKPVKPPKLFVDAMEKTIHSNNII